MPLKSGKNEGQGDNIGLLQQREQKKTEIYPITLFFYGWPYFIFSTQKPLTYIHLARLALSR